MPTPSRKDSTRPDGTRGITHALQQARRQDHAVVVLFIDLDDFKAINDQHGHTAGDLVLKTVADRVSGTLRECDTLARLAGTNSSCFAKNYPTTMRPTCAA